jgi:hypothetical protein
LTPKPGWYVKLENEKTGAYYVKPKSAADYKPGASILLAEVRHQTAERMAGGQTHCNKGWRRTPCLKEFLGKNRPQKKDAPRPWVYKNG